MTGDGRYSRIDVGYISLKIKNFVYSPLVQKHQHYKNEKRGNEQRRIQRYLLRWP